MNRQTPLASKAYVKVDFGSSPEIQARLWTGIMAEASRIQCPFSIIAREWQDHATATRTACCIAMVSDAASPLQAQELARLPYPVINVSNWIRPAPGLLHVLSDDEAVGAMAARHLLERGYRTFAMVGRADIQFSDERMRGFTRTVMAAGLDKPRSILIPYATDVDETGPINQVETSWSYFAPHMRQIDPVAGFFAVTDWLGHLLLDVLQLHIPERLNTTGVIGVDNMDPRRWIPGDRPLLSSVQPDLEAIGRFAIRYLAERMPLRRETPARILARIPPLDVVRRSSTGGYACANPIAGRAGRWIWERVGTGTPPSLDDVARYLHISARSVERLFSAHYQEGVKSFILHVQMDHALHLLRNSRMPVGDIAAACGFSDQSAFGRFFRRRQGLTPSAWRKQYRGQDRSQP